MLGILHFSLLKLPFYTLFFFLTATSSRQASISLVNIPSFYPIKPAPHHCLPSLHTFFNFSPMKFGKRLKRQIEQSLPDWRDKYLTYKELKKLVRLISSTPAPPLLKADEEEFLYCLNNEIEKFNAFFMEQEEDFIIRHKELQQMIDGVIDTWGPNGTKPSESEYEEEMGKIRKDIVNFHGEMVLLINYSNINYTGLAKIVKKYDKRTGGFLRLRLIQKVLEQPFFTTDLISKLVKECECIIDTVFPAAASEAKGMLHAEREVITVPGDGIFRNTVAALVTMQEIRRGSSTYSHFSLPPLNLPESDIIHSFHLYQFPDDIYI